MTDRSNCGRRGPRLAYLGANLVTHLGQAPEIGASLLASAERLAGMQDRLSPRAAGEDASA